MSNEPKHENNDDNSGWKVMAVFFAFLVAMELIDKI